MESRVKILGHPAHQMLIVFPLGLLVTAVVFDAVYLGTENPRWADIAFWMIASGLIGGLIAAVPGWIDWSAIPSGTRAKSVGLAHGLGNVGVLGLYAASWYLRMDDPGNPPVAAQVLSAAGLALGGVTAWLGGELVDRLGVGVDPGANLNAPNSLTHPPPGRGATTNP
jgi:uncharacterized membrane protein